jgi:hypothetical protein
MKGPDANGTDSSAAHAQVIQVVPRWTPSARAL